jgi:hypothetical protein
LTMSRYTVGGLGLRASGGVNRSGESPLNSSGMFHAKE